MYKFLRPLLFALPEEVAHTLCLKCLPYLPNFSSEEKSSPVSALGYQFKHPIGLAAGLDKNGEYINALAKVGFSFLEIGTVTPKPQLGNPKPRLFRIPQARAIINRMGFNNKGVDVLVENVKKSQFQGILGINIGKNKDTPLIKAAEDYLYCLARVYQHASYVVINISSPNTPELRALQNSEYLQTLLRTLKKEQRVLADRHKKYIPLLIKISPDETDEDIKRIATAIKDEEIDGIIATNTTNNHTSVEQFPHGNEIGGLSGCPLQSRSTRCLRLIKEVVGDDLTLIGVGGIHDGSSASERLASGAQLLQVYTGLIYEGPDLVATLVNALSKT